LQKGIEKKRTRRRKKEWASHQRCWAKERGDGVALEFQESRKTEPHWAQDFWHIIDTKTDNERSATIIIVAAGDVDPIPSGLDKI
jgi:hypothetical protein